jgi:hypothetical protein
LLLLIVRPAPPGTPFSHSVYYTKPFKPHRRGIDVIEDDGREIVADSILIQEGSQEMPAQAKKKVAKPKKVLKRKAPAKKKPALECGVCGYRVIVDETCGCAEEHVLVCCGQPMNKKKA